MPILTKINLIYCATSASCCLLFMYVLLNLNVNVFLAFNKSEPKPNC